MLEIIGTYIRLILTVLIFVIFAFVGIKIGISLRKKKNLKEGIE